METVEVGEAHHPRAGEVDHPKGGEMDHLDSHQEEVFLTEVVEVFMDVEASKVVFQVGVVHLGVVLQEETFNLGLETTFSLNLVHLLDLQINQK